MCRGTRGGHTPPAPFLLNLGRSNEECEQEMTSAGVTGRRHEAGRNGRSSPPLAPSQGCGKEKTSAGMTVRRHEVGRQGPVPLLSFPVRDASRRRHLPGATARGRAPWMRIPSSRSQSGTRAGDKYCRKWAANRGRGQPSQRNAEGSPVNSFPRIELGAPP